VRADIYGAAKIAPMLAQWGMAPKPEEIAKRMRWRDRRLAALKAHKRSQPAY
jgi:hypothetical protein